MALTADRLKNVKKFRRKLKLIVFGYIRHHTAEIFNVDETSGCNLLVNAFGDIQHYVLAFYGDYDKWDESAIGQGLVLNNNIISKHVDGPWCYRSAFLTNICEEGVHHWTFKIHKLNKIWNLIGIWRVSDDSPIPTETYFPETNLKHSIAGYALCLGAGKLVNTSNGGSLVDGHYCDKCKEDDIVEMTLDLEQLELRYAVNGKDQGKAFKVQPCRKYRAAVCFDGESASIELLI